MIKTLASNQRAVRILYLLVLTLSFLTIYTSIFDKKVSLVGDNVSYYILGNAIADGDGYINTQHLEQEQHYHYPPGYPLLIASVATFISNNVYAVKIANGVLFFGAILLLFFIVKRLTSNEHIAFATSFLSLLNYHLLTYSTIMMSEIPFLFFSLLAIWLLLKTDFSKSVFKNWSFLILIVSVSFSFYIRSIGAALFVSLVFFLFIKKYWKYLYTFVGAFVLLYIPWFMRSQASTGNTYVSQLFLKNPYERELGTANFVDIFERFIINIERYITKEIPSSIIHSNDVIYSETAAPFLEWLLGFTIIGIILFGLFRLPKYKMFMGTYLLTFFGLLLIWPSVWYGTRFILPLIPILIFLFIYGIIKLISLLSIKAFSKKQHYITSGLPIFLLAFWAFMYGKDAIPKLKEQASNEYADSYKNYFALADWVQQNASENAITAVRKEGLFYLFSKKPVTSYQKTLDKEAQIDYLKRKKVTYVVVEQLGYSSTSKYLVPVIDRYPNKFKLIKELKKPNTYLMQFLPELGYTGTWENGKRNGVGTYVWEDGQKYIGEWRNDVRHGKGTVFFANGESLSGVWENGKLNGEVIKKGKNNEILEKSIYKDNKKVEVIFETN